MFSRRNGLRVYRALLLVYPAEFRHEYGAEMERLFALRRETEPHVRLWCEAIADAALVAPNEHLHILSADLKLCGRVFAKTPGFVLAALFAIVLGVCATTTVFSLVHAVLIRSLPYGNPERLTYMWAPAPGVADVPREHQPFYSDIVAWQKSSRSFTNITAMRRYIAVVGDQRIGAAKVLGNFFQTLEASPQLGRLIDAADEPLVAVISDGLWRSRFLADPNVIGTTIYVDRQPYRVIGVMPREFSYPHGNDFPGQYQFASLPRTDLWVPAALTPKQLADPNFDDMDAVIGRLRDGIALKQAQSEMSAIEKRIAPLHPYGWTNQEVLLVPFLETSIGPVRPLMRLLMGAVCMVLLMAGGNLASLLMARAANRVHELGVRTALGAKRSRLIRLMLTESVALAALGGLLAVPASYAVLQAVVRLNPGDIPRFEETTLDASALLFGLFVALATGFIAGVFPAVSASRISPVVLLRHGGRGIQGVSLRLRNALIVSEIALTVVLLAAALLLIRSYLKVQGEDKGFSPSTLTLSILVDQPLPNSDPLRREAMNRIRLLPGVEAAGSIDDLPLSTFEDKGFLEVEGLPTLTRKVASVRETGGEYFQAMQIPLVEGRYLNDGDIARNGQERALSVVVSESLVKRYFAGRNATGHRLRINGSAWSTIVGVVGDVRHSSLEEMPQPTVYYQNGLADSVAIRTSGSRDAMIGSVRTAMSEWNAGVTVTDIQTMDQYVNQSTARRRFQTVALTSFAGVAVVLALAGFYGLLSYAVMQRTAEVGVRMALGASRRKVIGMVVRYGLKLSAAGLAVGLCLAALLIRVVASFLYGVEALDPVTFLVVPAFTIGVTVIACIPPAWRASRVDPVNALRQQ